ALAVGWPGCRCSASSAIRIGSGTCHLQDKVEKPALARTRNAPVHRHALIAFIETFVLHAKIEIAPRGVLTDGGYEVVPGLVEVEMIVLVEKDRHGAIAPYLASLPDHLS